MLPLAQRLAERSGPSTSLCCRTLVRKRHKQNTIIALIHKHAQIQLKVDRDRVRAYHHRSRLQQAPYTYYVAHLRTSTAGRTIRIRRAYITHNRDCIARGIVRYQRARLIITLSTTRKSWFTGSNTTPVGNSNGETLSIIESIATFSKSTLLADDAVSTAA
jgi:hypothetical protein